MTNTFNKKGILITDYLVGPPTGETMEIAPFHSPLAEIDNLTVGTWTGASPSGGGDSTTPPTGQLFTITCDISTNIWDTSSPYFTNKTMDLEFFKQGRMVCGRTSEYIRYLGQTSMPSWGGIIEPSGIYTITLVPQTPFSSALVPTGINAFDTNIPITASRLSTIMDGRCANDIIFYNNGTPLYPVLQIKIRMYNPGLSASPGLIYMTPMCFSYVAAS